MSELERPNYDGLLDPGTILDRKFLYELDKDQHAEWRLIVEPTGWAEWKPVVVRNEDDRVVFEPVWQPLPGSQSTFLRCPAYEALYAGNRGPGKSIALLMDFAQDVGRGFGSSWVGVVFRREYKDLDDFVKKAEEWYTKMFPGFKFLRSKSEYMAVWPSGERLRFRHMENEDGYNAFHGHELPWIGWEELTQWPDDVPYKKMMSCSRSSTPGIIPRVRATTNPSGAGHGWVKKRFQLPDGYGKIIRIPGEMPRMSFRADLDENFILLNNVPNYKATIRQAAPNKSVADAWLYGSWDITTGGMFDDVFERKHHVVPCIEAKKIPLSWTVSRSYDHGQSHPFSYQLWLESSGEPIKIDGVEIGRVRGDLILWKEWYGCSPGDEKIGLRMPSKKIAKGIKDREEDWGISGRVLDGPADTEIFNKKADRDNRSPADDMEDEGIRWERADKSPGSRKRGYELIRTKLIDAVPNKEGTREAPGLFVCTDCRQFLEFFPTTPRGTADPDEVPDGYPDHILDSTRYRVSWLPPGMWRRGF